MESRPTPSGPIGVERLGSAFNLAAQLTRFPDPYNPKVNLNLTCSNEGPT